MKQKLPLKIKVSYSLGQLGWSILSGIIQVWLVWFYFPPNNVDIVEFIPRGAILGFLTIIGIITMLGRFLDAVTDPWIAGLSDASKNPKGRRIPYLAKACIPFTILTVLVYCSPINATSWVNVMFLLVSLLSFYIFFTMYVTPYFALTSELSENSNDRLDLSTYIALTWFVGYIIASAASFIWPVFEGFGFSLVASIRITFIILALVALVFLLIPVIMIDEKKYVTSTPTTLKPYQAIKETLKNKNFLLFEIFFLAYGIAITVFQTGNVYYVTVLLDYSENVVMYITAGSGLFAFLLYPLVNKFSKKIGKKRLCVFGMCCLIIAYFYCSMLGKMPFPPFVQSAIFAMIAGIGFAIFGILPNAIVADIAKVDSVKTKESKEGMFFAVQTFMNKIGQMLAMVIFSSLLLLGKDKNHDLGIRLSGIVAAVIGVFALFIFFQYKDVEEDSE